MKIVLALLLTAFSGCGRMRQQPTERIVTLSAGAVVVGAGKYWDEPFKVPAGASAFVDGHVTAFGGSGRDIGVFVVSDDAFVNLINHHEFQDFFGEPKTSAATLHVGPLPAGAYHLVFENEFSLFSKKTVVSDIVERLTFR